MQIPVHASVGQIDDAMRLVSGKLDPLAFECVPYTDWVAFGVACDEALAGVIVSGRPDPKLSRRIVTLREEVASGLVWVQGLGVFGRMGTLEQPEGVIAVSARRVYENPVLFPARYHQARASGFLRAHARSIRAASQLSRDLRRYAVNGLLADPPHTSNVAFAQGCRCDPSRLEYRFRELPGVTPKEFCQAVLAVHVGMRRPFGCSWEWLAGELRIDIQRFRRATSRHLDCTPSQAAEDHGAHVMRWFHEYLTGAFALSASDAENAEGGNGDSGV